MPYQEEFLLRAYRSMRTIREFEERCIAEFMGGNVPGFVHASNGQEAIAVAACIDLSDSDIIGSTHRGHGHCIAKGCDIGGMMKEIMGRSTGLCKGKGGSMHIADIDKGGVFAHLVGTLALLSESEQARVKGFVPLDHDAAAILAERGVVEADGLFYWRNDQRLKAASMVKFSKDHLQSFLTAIRGRVILVQAQNSAFTPSPEQSAAFEWIPHMKIIKLPGSHHLHLEGQAEQVARSIQPLFT